MDSKETRIEGDQLGNHYSSSDEKWGWWGPREVSVEPEWSTFSKLIFLEAKVTRFTDYLDVRRNGESRIHATLCLNNSVDRNDVYWDRKTKENQRTMSQNPWEECFANKGVVSCVKYWWGIQVRWGDKSTLLDLATQWFLMSMTSSIPS